MRDYKKLLNECAEENNLNQKQQKIMQLIKILFTEILGSYLDSSKDKDLMLAGNKQFGSKPKNNWDLIPLLDFYLEHKVIGKIQNQLTTVPIQFTKKNVTEIRDFVDCIVTKRKHQPMEKIDNINLIVEGILIDLKKIEGKVPDPKGQIYRIDNNIPSPEYTEFFGRTQEIEKLKNVLMEEHGASIITISGHGGIGKTALAQDVVRSLLDDSADELEYICWNEAKTRQMQLDRIVDIPAEPVNLAKFVANFQQIAPEINDLDDLRYYLEGARCVLVFDNMETVEDTNLINFISEIRWPSKVLMTTRRRPGSMNNTFDLELGELEEAEAKKFIEYEGATKAKIVTNSNKLLEKIKEGDSAIIDKIYERIQGNPLHLKITIGRIAVSAGEKLNHILGKSNQNLFDFCFEGTYDELSSTSKKLFCVIGLGANQNQMYQNELQAITAFDNNDDFDDAITELKQRSLIEEHSGDNKIFYKSLPLTKKFARKKLNELDDALQQELRDNYTRYATGDKALRVAVGQRANLLNTKYGPFNDSTEQEIAYRCWMIINLAESDEEKREANVRQMLKDIPKDYQSLWYVKVTEAMVKYKLSSNLDIDIAAIRELFDSALNVGHEDYRIYKEWFSVEFNNNNYAEAIEICDRWIGNRNDMPEVYIYKARTKNKQGKYNEANEIYDNVFEVIKRIDEKITDKQIYKIAYRERIDNLNRLAEKFNRDEKQEEAIKLLHHIQSLCDRGLKIYEEQSLMQALSALRGNAQSRMAKWSND